MVMRETNEKQKILVVEDEPDIRQVLSFFLRQAGYDILAVAGVQEAIDRLPTYLPDLIILDILMRPVPGWRVLEWVRMQYADSAVPVLILTALVQFSHQIEGLERGATEYITKPMQPSRVVDRVQKLLAQSAEQRYMYRQSGINERRQVLNHLADTQKEEFL